MALLEKQRKELELKLQRKLIAKAQHSVTQTERPVFFQETAPVNKTGNQLIDQLNLSKRQQQLRDQRVIQMKRSRVYTFDDDDEVEQEVRTCNEVEKYSGKLLMQRYISASKLDQFFQDKKVLRLDKLFAKVVAPHFKEPDYFNWCVIGVIVKKSEPMFTTGNKSSKYMKVTISDFNISLELSLFDQLFQKYWKLKVGDLILVLNPQIWINRNKKFSTNVNAFSITLRHDYNSILEIGKLSVNYCPSIKKGGEKCGVVIGVSEKYCYFHQELLIRKTTSKRMEFNGSFKMYDPVQNGVKQQVLLSKDDHKIKASIFNDPFAEKIDRFSVLSKKFSNTELLKLFFNDDLLNIKQKYMEGQRESKKRKVDKVEEVKPELSYLDKQKLMRQKLKASIIKDEFKSNVTNDSDDDDDLQIIF